MKLNINHHPTDANNAADPDPLLREMFAQLRAEDHAVAPPWQRQYLRTTSTAPAVTTRWMWPAMGAAACACALLAFWPRSSASPRADLSSLPPLMLHAQTAVLLQAEPANFLSTTSPTDFLLPTHLTIHIL